MSRVKIDAKFEGNNETWASVSGAPHGGIIENVVNIGYVQKWQSGAIYPVLCVGFSWEQSDDNEAVDIMGQLHKGLLEMDIMRRDQWTEKNRRYQVWAYRNPYNNDDIIGKVQSSLARSGFKKVEDFPGMVEYWRDGND